MPRALPTLIVHRNHGLRIGTVFFDAEPDGTPIDCCRYVHRTTPVGGSLCEPRCTLVVDLRRSVDELLAAIDKDAAYEVRRARDKDQVACVSAASPGAVVRGEFWPFFQQFCQATGLPPAAASAQQWLIAAADGGRIEITVARDAAGEALAYHVYWRGDDRPLLMYACSLHRLAQAPDGRARIGRANRFLFWSDLLRFKESGMDAYDFGGWYEGTDDAHLQRINRSKAAFGGQVVRVYNCMQGRTWLGKAAVWLQKLRQVPRQTRR